MSEMHRDCAQFVLEYGERVEKRQQSGSWVCCLESERMGCLGSKSGVLGYVSGLPGGYGYGL